MTDQAALRWRQGIAVAAAYLLVLQVLVVGLAGGTFANVLSVDRTLAVSLCLPGGNAAPDDRGGEPKRHADLSCCMAGCPMAAADAAPLAGLSRLVEEPGELAIKLPQAELQADLAFGQASYASRAPPILG